jgi:hypothetical protein
VVLRALDYGMWRRDRGAEQPSSAGREEDPPQAHRESHTLALRGDSDAFELVESRAVFLGSRPSCRSGAASTMEMPWFEIIESEDDRDAMGFWKSRCAGGKQDAALLGPIPEVLRGKSG